MQQTLARRAAKDASPRLPIRRRVRPRSRRTPFAWQARLFFPSCRRAASPALMAAILRVSSYSTSPRARNRMIRSSPENARDAKASPGAQKANCAAQSSSAAAGSVCRVSSR